KVQWLPLTALMLALKGRWRALGGLAAVGAALALETTLVIGREWVPAYAGVLTRASSSGSEYLLTPAASHSLNGGIYALLGPGNAACSPYCGKPAFGCSTLHPSCSSAQSWTPPARCLSG